ncbi:MAG: hypothetical protein NXI29_09265 [bacterium]|uniref:Uncharacterized protein n=1 Tax=Gimesia chilikensis TaxID=2605989 RepID=A0A517PII4_9PLAN|nr:hypothetical protein [Gimesia chilikensis]MCR9231187.1 hypothetical protein [bacterium]QDT19165.1 hypothetical protein HG66A1_09290 [Gimesia chilikensis]
MTEQAGTSSWLKRIRIFTGLLLMALAVGGAVMLATAGGMSSGTLASGRSVTAQSDSWKLDATYSGDTATIKTAGFNIEVTPDRLNVDRQRIAFIDSRAKSVGVKVKANEIIFHADGKWVATYRR